MDTINELPGKLGSDRLEAVENELQASESSIGCFKVLLGLIFENLLVSRRTNPGQQVNHNKQASQSLNWEFLHLLCLRQPLFCQRGVNPEITALSCDKL